MLRHALDERDEFRVDGNALYARARQEGFPPVIIVNPNSPTGKLWDRQELAAFVRNMRNTVIVDETYIDYVGSAASLECMVAQLHNLVIIKSMSKAYALSGARVGYMAASKTATDDLRPFFPPWSVGLIGQLAAVEALKDARYYEEKYRETHELRKEMSASLGEIPYLKTFPSVANFLLSRLPAGRSARDVVQQLRGQGIYIRDCSSMSPQLSDRYLRITVKDQQTNAQVVGALRKVIAPHAPS